MAVPLPPADPRRVMTALEGVPPPAGRNVAVRVDRSAERAIRKGHPWLFAEGVRQESHRGAAGDLAVLFDQKRDFLAVGLYDPESPLRVRVLHRGRPRTLDDGFYAERLGELVARRAGLEAGGTDGYRLVNGENEGMPGLVADRYGGVVVIKLYTPAWLPHLRRVLPALLAAQPAEHLVLRLSRDTQRREAELHGLADGDVLVGADLEPPVVFRENHLRFECDPLHGQKTGFFLDQRDNRARVETLAAGRDVLNVFSYTGGFSLAAARGGARRITSLDQSKPALAAAERNFELNADVPGVAAAEHELVAADAFAWLDEQRREGPAYDLVIIDPPSLARRQADVPGALAAYGRLVTRGLGCLRSGGTFVMASCSARVPADDFFELVHRAAREAGRPLDEFERTGHAPDHPVGFPQGAYLKCLYARA